jgi:hypothetical protein
MLLNILSALLVLLLLAGCGLALIYASLPKKWQRVLAPGAKGVTGVVGDMRLAAGRWELDDITRRVIRELEGRAQVTMNQAFLPNTITVRLAPSDTQRFDALIPAMRDDLQERVSGLQGKPARGRGTPPFAFVGRIEVSVVADRDVPPGTMKVSSEFSADTIIEAPNRRAVEPRRAATNAEPRWKLGNADGEFELRGETLIGRARGCGLRLKDCRVSVHHARVTTDATRPLLEDLGSTNGTFVNGEPLSGARLLQSGDLVSFGGSPALRVVWDCATVPC